MLQLIAEGCSNPAIAERLGITLRSAEKHVSSIFAKLGLPDTGTEHRRVLAVLRFLAAPDAAPARPPGHRPPGHGRPRWRARPPDATLGA